MEKSDLANRLKNTVGLTDTQASQVLYCVKSYLEDRVPGFLAERLDEVFAGKKVDLSDILKEKAGAALGQFVEKTEEVSGKVTDKVDDTIKKVSEFFNTDKKQ